MFDFTEVQLENITVHNIGNKSKEETLRCSNAPLELQEDIIKELLLKYFLSPFKGETYYNFSHETDLNLNEIFNYSSSVFENLNSFHLQSINIAKHLFEQSQHPKIKGGEFYVVLLRNCIVDGEQVDALGLFKSENKDTYLKVFQQNNNFEIDHEEGININKLDKGCLIFNTEKELGYKVCIVDTINKEEAHYWKQDFLNLKPREDNFYHTKNALNMCKSFCEEVLTPKNNIEKKDQLWVKSKSAEYFNKKGVFNSEEFADEVLTEPSAITAFNDYKKEYIQKNDLNDIEDFEISNAAVKVSKQMFKSVLKLDKNFSIYVHGKHSQMEKGFDDDRNMNYYKFYFEKEV